MKKLLLLGISISIFLTVQAQSQLGIINGNYAGVNGVGLNPSSMVDGRISWDVNVGSGSFTFDNTFLYIPQDSLKFFGFGNLLDQMGFEPHYNYGDSTIDTFYLKGYQTNFDINDPYKTYDLTWNMVALGPSFMVNFGKNHNHALAFNTGAKYYLTLNDVPGHQAQNAYKEYRDTSLWGTNWVDQTSKINLMGWFEYGLSYATVLYNKNKNEVKGGITGKYLDGVAGAYVKNVNQTYNIINDTSLYMAGSIDYGHTNYNEYDFIHKYSDLIHGSGFGASIGFTYIRKKDSADYTYDMNCKKYTDPDKNNYNYRIGLSLIDIGSIKFDKTAETFHLQSDSVLYGNYRSAKFENHYDFDTTLSSVIMGDPYASHVADNFTMKLPTTLSVQFDWNIYKNFYLNATILKGISNIKDQAVRSPDIYSLTPRYEHKWFEVSLPFSVINYNELRARYGIALRAGYFYVGGDALGGIMGFRDFVGADIYGGVHFFIPSKKLKDTDGDLVSDKLDSCLLDKGECKTNGCPDRDKDGVIDKLDRCPDVPGLVYLKGCPDADNDSIPDIDDKCPDEPGLREFAGCPDRDLDKIPDKDDACPDEPGLAKFAGCPDRDGDNIIDKKDKCPDVPGLQEYDGCPAPIIPPVPPAPPVITGVLFKINSAVIEPDTYSILDNAADIIKATPGTKWAVEGYTDNTGSDKINNALSLRRAQAVKDYLIKRGVNGNDITAQGFGKLNPVATNDTPAGRDKNRRVEIKTVK